MAEDHVAALPKGYCLKEFVVERVLGQGAFGITYLALDSHLNTWVAIKEYLPDDLAIRDEHSTVVPKSAASRASYVWGLERFFSEAQTVARFNHPNIVRVLRLMRENGTAYIIMPYERGLSLADHLKRLDRPLREGEMLALLRPLLDGLAAVHAEDVLHRDLKPGNIFLRVDGTPVLLDFGSARQAVRGERQDMTSVLTPGYAPIEQYSDSSHQGPWTDIYALGAVLYRCLTGKAPADATKRSEHILNRRPDPLTPAADYAAEKHPGAYAAPLLKAIDTALAVSADDRPRSVDDWRDMLTQARDRTGQPRQVFDAAPNGAAGAAASAPASSAGPLGRRSALGLALGAACVLCVLVAALGPWVPWSPFRAVEPSTVVPTASEMETGPAAPEPQSAPADPDRTESSPSDQPSASATTLTNHPPEASLAQAVPPVPSGDPADALAWWRERAAAGDVAAQRHLAVTYRDGIGATQDFREAAHWFQEAAEAGDGDAQVQLALMLREGMGVRRDLARSLALLNSAADQWHPAAAYEIGRAYRDGLGIDADPSFAVRWFRRAAEQGEPGAMVALGRAYAGGSGVARNPTRSLAWFQRAVEQGAGGAAIEISRLYTDGLGVERDPAEAVRWAALALSSDDTKTAQEAQSQLTQLGDRAWVQAAYRLLQNAGYQPGPERPWPSQDLHTAIRAFQRDSGRQQTGDVTLPLLAALAERQ